MGIPFFLFGLIVLYIPFMVLRGFLSWKEFKINSFGNWLKIFLIGFSVASICYMLIQIMLIYFVATYPKDEQYINSDYLSVALVLGIIGGFRAISIVKKHQPKT